MASINPPYWADDPGFPKMEHYLIVEKVFPVGDDCSGSCACGEYLGIGANYTMCENFDFHAEKIQRIRYA